MMYTGKKETNLTLVLGGTGKTGRRVVERLRKRNLQVRIASRTATPPFDWQDSKTWTPILDNVTSVYIAFYPDLALPGATATIRAFVDRATQCGVRRLLLLSGRGEEEAQRCEHIVQESGLDWTILRASWFSQNFSEAFLREMILSGVVALPVGRVREPFVDANDIADVAVAALTEPGHSGKLYELTGPRLLSFAEAVGEIARATGREIAYQSVSSESFIATMAEQGVPSHFISLLSYLFSEVLDGRNSRLNDGVQRALGRRARDFSTFASDAAAAGAWCQ